MDKEDLHKRVSLIEDKSIREFTLAIVDGAPLRTWFAPASRKHHLLDERGDWGNLLHTIRVVSLCGMLADVLSMSTGEKDIFISAAILHDICRYGISAGSTWSLPEHPALVRQLARELNVHCEHENEIFSAIETHMGKWSTYPVLFTDESDIPLMLHIADCVVARWAEVVPTA